MNIKISQTTALACNYAQILFKQGNREKTKMQKIIRNLHLLRTTLKFYLKRLE